MTRASTSATDDAQASDEPVWARGDYDRAAPHYLDMAAAVVEAAEITGEDTVLDVATGTGSVAITAARRGADVTGVDITPPLLAEAESHAAVAGVDDIAWDVGDAADLPYPDDHFDATVSNLGHMYGDPPDVVADELRRVTAPGGRLAFTSWTPTTAFPAVAQRILPHLDPADLPDVTAPPFLWGDPDIARDRVGDGLASFETEVASIGYPARSPAHFWESMRATSGLLIDVLDAVSAETEAELTADAVETIADHFDETRNAVELEYLLATGQRA